MKSASKYTGTIEKQMAKLADQMLKYNSSSNYIFRLSKNQYDLERKQYDLDRKKFSLHTQILKAFQKYEKRANASGSGVNSAYDKGAKIVNDIMKTTSKFGKTTLKGQTTLGDFGSGGATSSKSERIQGFIKDKISDGVRYTKLAVGLLSSLETLRNVPSALGAVLNLLEFGILFLLKPMADLLASWLMPIALALIKFGMWLNGLNEWEKKAVGILELVLVGLAGYFGFLGKTLQTKIQGVIEAIEKIAGKGAKVLGNIAEKLKPVYDAFIELCGKIGSKLKGILTDALEGLLRWVNGSRLPEWINKAEEALEKLYIKLLKFGGEVVDKILTSIGKLFGDEAGNFSLKFITDPLEALGKVILKCVKWVADDLLGGVFTKILDIFDKWGIKGALEGILAWFGEKGLLGILGIAFRGFISILDLGWVNLIAGLFAWIVGWIASYIDENNPIKPFIMYLFDSLLFLEHITDVFGLMYAAIVGVYNALFSGDFSFGMLAGKLKNIGRDICNTFVDIIMGLVGIAKKVGIDIPIQLTRCTTDFEDVDKNVKISATNVGTSGGLFDSFNGFMAGIGKTASDILGGFGSIFTATQSLNESMTQHAKNGSGNNSNNPNNPSYLQPDNSYSSDNQDPNHKITPAPKQESWMNSSDPYNMFPKYASGGIVTSPTIAMVGESGSEAIIPLDKLNNGLSNVNINFSGLVDEQKFRTIIQQEATKIFNQHKRVSNTMW